ATITLRPRTTVAQAVGGSSQRLLRRCVCHAPPHRAAGLLRAQRRRPKHRQQPPDHAPCSSHTRPLTLKVSLPCNTILPLPATLSRRREAGPKDPKPLVVARHDDHATAIRAPQPCHVAHLSVDHDAAPPQVDAREPPGSRSP